MKKELSILIPTFNYDPSALVASLQRQAKQFTANGLQYEIIVGDDGSTIPISPSCQVIRMEHNTGRAAIRNTLAKASQYQWLLFLDSDIVIDDEHFLEHYLTCPANEVIDGGIRVGIGPSANLRFIYEKASEPKHTAKEREQHPYKSFRTTNFMISRPLMLQYPFDERFKHYGYEDVLFGKVLQQNNVQIKHIKAPVLLTDFEANRVFVEKTEEGLRTLHQFQEELYDYSTLLQRLAALPLLVRQSITLFHRAFSSFERRILIGNSPKLWIFSLYRLGYYLNIKT